MRDNLVTKYKAKRAGTTGFSANCSEAFIWKKQGKGIDEVTPFWRILNPKSKLAKN